MSIEVKLQSRIEFEKHYNFPISPVVAEGSQRISIGSKAYQQQSHWIKPGLFRNLFQLAKVDHSIFASPRSSSNFKLRSASSILMAESRRMPAARVPQYGQIFHNNSINRLQFSQVFLSLV